MTRKSRLFLSLVIALGSAAIVGSSADSQTSNAAKLIVYSVNFNGPGLNTSSAGLQLQRGNQTLMSFTITIPHVDSVDQALAKLKPEVDRIADDLKNAPIEKQP
jgi:hypothetical protein